MQDKKLDPKTIAQEISTAAEREVQFPAKRADLLAKYGERRVPIAGHAVPMKSVLLALPREEFASREEFVKSVEESWSRVESLVHGAPIER